MRRWIPALVAACELLSLLTGLVLGWFVVWFQIAGRAERDDYLMAAAAYAAGALVVLLGLPALARLGVRGWAFALSAVGGMICALLALWALTKGLSMEQVSVSISPWYDGAGGVLACPWTWPPIVLGVLALVGLGPQALSSDAELQDAR